MEEDKVTNKAKTAEELKAEAIAAAYLDVDAFVEVARNFIEFCAAFNRQDLDFIDPLLAADAIVYRVRTDEPLIGKAAVKEYLKEKFEYKPICAPVTVTLHPPSLPTLVHGVALWTTKTTGTAGQTDYASEFSFNYELRFQPA